MKFQFSSKVFLYLLSSWINKSFLKSTHTHLGNRSSEAELRRKCLINNKNWPYKTYCRDTAPQKTTSRLLSANDCISLFNYCEWIRVSRDSIRSTCSLYRIQLELQPHSFADSHWWCWSHFPWGQRACRWSQTLLYINESISPHEGTDKLRRCT